MQLDNSFEELVPKINAENFKSCALELFRFQARENFVYREYVNMLRIDPKTIDELNKIPFLPIEFFKNKVVKTHVWEEETIFKSSGTSGLSRSKNYVKNLNFYHDIATRGFVERFGDLQNFVILGLLPSYVEMGDSSLVSMVDFFIDSSKNELSGYI